MGVLSLISYIAIRLRPGIPVGIVVILSMISACTAPEAVREKLASAFPRDGKVAALELPAKRPEQVVAAWVVGEPPEPAGYGLRVRGRSRSGSFTALLALDADCTIRHAEVERYLGERGGEIRRESFENQFEDKAPGAALRVGEDIDAVTGATISSRAMTDAVRQSIRWLHTYARN